MSGIIESGPVISHREVIPDVNACVLPFIGAVVVPQNNMKDGPVEQRLHLNL